MQKQIQFVSIIVFCCFLASPIHAIHLGANSINLPGTSLVDQPEFFISHRFYGDIDDKPFENFFGIDSGANTTIGFGLRINDKFDSTILRSPLDKEYYISCKYQANAGMSLLAAVSSKTAPYSISNRTSNIFQVIYEKEIKKDLLYLGFVPTYVSTQTFDPTIAFGASIGFLVIPELEALVEYIPTLSGNKLAYPAFSVGIKIITWGHYFALMLSNTPQTLPNGYVLGSADNKFHFGFNLIRRFF